MKSAAENLGFTLGTGDSMPAAFAGWSAVALLFFTIGIRTRRLRTAAGFFTFIEPPKVEDVALYNRDVSRLWLSFAAAFELTGLPLLFLSQNHPAGFLVILAPIFLVILLCAAYLKILNKHRK